MHESSKMYSLRLPAGPPVVQVRRAPGEPNIPSETYMRDGISTSGAGLFSNPGFRNAPSLGQFFRGQHFEEWPSCCLNVLRLFSTHISCLCFNDLHGVAVLNTGQRTGLRLGSSDPQSSRPSACA